MCYTIHTKKEERNNKGSCQKGTKKGSHQNHQKGAEKEAIIRPEKKKNKGQKRTKKRTEKKQEETKKESKKGATQNKESSGKAKKKDRQYIFKIFLSAFPRTSTFYNKVILLKKLKVCWPKMKKRLPENASFFSEKNALFSHHVSKVLVPVRAAEFCSFSNE